MKEVTAFAMGFGVFCGLGTRGNFVDVIPLCGEKPSDKSSETSWQIAEGCIGLLDTALEAA